MAENAQYPSENDNGCGFMGFIFRLKGFRPRNPVLFQSSSKSAKTTGKKSPGKPTPARVSDAARTSTTSSSSNNSVSKRQSQLANSLCTGRLKTIPSPTFNSGELSLTLDDDQIKSDPNGTLYRASTGNVMLLGHLGSLKNQGKGSKSVTKKPMEMSHQFGNILQRSPRNRLNPDVIKSLGNQKYRQGKYEEALALYNQAISIDPNNACYYSNKSAALMGLGRLVEAVLQCKEAIRIDSSYHNAHFRLGKLYLRLGVAEKAAYHCKLSGHKASREEIAQAEALKNCLEKSIEARKHGEWEKLLNESQIALSLGADSAPQIYTMKAEALMKLHRHQQAYDVMEEAARFSIEVYGGLLGSCAAAALLEVRALVYMANGRFEDAVAAVEEALRLDSSNSVFLTAERVRSVALARLNGNKLFKGSRFSEALVAYNIGLEKDPHNSVLLCNRAACRSKLGQYEKAVDDCTMALFLRPSYTKARLRRANCYAELEKWDAAVQDYEVLTQEIPGDEDVRAAFLEATMQLNKLHNGHRIQTHTIYQG